MCSTQSLLDPYGLMGLKVAVSTRGVSSGMPYTAAVEEKTSRPTPVWRIASSRDRALTVLFRKYLPGLAHDSPASM